MTIETSFMSAAMLSLLIFFIIFKIFPPKKINHLYGYRTSGSMKNIYAWNLANKYSSTLLIIFFSALFVISYILELLNINVEILMLVLMVLAFALTVILTEKKLKNFN